MAGSDDYFEYLNGVYDLLPPEDIARFGELWRAIEQTYGNVITKIMEQKLGVSVNTVPLYNNERWLQHTFDDSTIVEAAATYQTNQDLSAGINLTQRFLLKIGIDGSVPIEFSVAGANAATTKNYEIVAAINKAFGFTLTNLVVENALIKFTSKTVGPTSRLTFYPASMPTQDAMALIVGLDPSLLPQSFPNFPYQYQLGDKTIVDIPKLQTTIHNPGVLPIETIVLLENTDYAIEFGSAIISFAAVPPTKMWAANNFKNLNTPYNNFGYLMNFFDVNTPAYLKAVQGLWYAYWTGPTPENIRRSLYLLFGLPTASNAGTVTAVTATQIILTYLNNATETFAIPTDLTAMVNVGDTVTRFQPLVSGITVLDKVNSPGFVKNQIGRFGIQGFLTQYATRGNGPLTDETIALTTLEENTYLPQVNVNAFISDTINLGNVRTFLDNIQPKSRDYFFQVIVGEFSDALGMVEGLEIDYSFDVTPNVDSNPNTDCQQSDREYAENNPTLTGLILDSEVLIMTDTVEIDVYNNSILVESFSVEG